MTSENSYTPSDVNFVENEVAMQKCFVTCPVLVNDTQTNPPLPLSKVAIIGFCSDNGFLFLSEKKTILRFSRDMAHNTQNFHNKIDQKYPRKMLSQKIRNVLKRMQNRFTDFLHF